jgi:glycerol-3-phosphate acyltransferase PlsY
MQIYATVAVVSYLLGSIPFGYILVRLFLKTDVRTLGSGNIGATNVGRTGHRGLAIATLLLDAGKGVAAVLLTRMWLAHQPWPVDFQAGMSQQFHLFESLAALFAIAGHMFPVWLRFKGGKGVATGVGAFASLAPLPVLIVVGIFLLLVAVFRYVSLGSVVASGLFPVALYASTWFDDIRAIQSPYPVDRNPAILALIFVVASAALIVVRHHQNIRRLIAGTENKLGAKAPLPTNPAQKEKDA